MQTYIWLESIFKNKLFKLECSYWIQAFMMLFDLAYVPCDICIENTLLLRDFLCLIGTFQLNLYLSVRTERKNFHPKEVSVGLSSKNFKKNNRSHLEPLPTLKKKERNITRFFFFFKKHQKCSLQETLFLIYPIHGHQSKTEFIECYLPR